MKVVLHKVSVNRNGITALHETEILPNRKPVIAFLYFSFGLFVCGFFYIQINECINTAAKQKNTNGKKKYLQHFGM